VHSFGRANQLDRAALLRLVTSIKRVLDVDPAEVAPARGTATLPEIDIDAVVPDRLQRITLETGTAGQQQTRLAQGWHRSSPGRCHVTPPGPDPQRAALRHLFPVPTAR
jgi:hypothetical protein